MQSVIAEPKVFEALYTSEIWAKKKPVYGDHIRVKRIGGLYAHHGIYVTDDEIIHFTGNENDSILDWSKPEVICSDLAYFLKDGELEVKEYTDEEFNDLYTPEQIVDYARACLGDKGYNLFFNNCEHFANVCTLGRFRSNQVERVAMGKLPNEEEKNMGFLGDIIDGVKNFFSGGKSNGGSRSTSNTTTNTTYEPDKVKIAEIEADTKIRLANMEMERIELMKQAKIDMLQFETESQIAIEEAKVKGFMAMAQTIIALQNQLNEVAQKRLIIIEKGSLELVKELELFYDELGAKIKTDQEMYSAEKLPKLLAILGEYEEGSVQHTIYAKQIEKDMDAQMQHYYKQIENLSLHQAQIIESMLTEKSRMLAQTDSIVVGLLESASLNTKAISTEKEDIQYLSSGERLALESGSK